MDGGRMYVTDISVGLRLRVKDKTRCVVTFVEFSL
jgi:hypothetical protein